MRYFGIDPHKSQDHVSLSVCPIGPGDTEHDEKLALFWREEGVEPPQFLMPTKQVPHTLTPWLGTEVGFLHAGEAEDAIRPDRRFRRHNATPKTKEGALNKAPSFLVKSTDPLAPLFRSSPIQESPDIWRHTKRWIPQWLVIVHH